MKEEIVSFKVAKLAKEKGFNEEVLWKYREKDEDSPYLFTSSNSENVVLGNYYEFCKVEKDCLPAPTQSLLQRWLREVHGEVVIINVEFSENNNLLYDYIHYSKIVEEEIEYYDGQFNTYEQALEAGLEKALNIIKEQN